MADHRRVKQLFLAAREVAAEERRAWLAEACGTDVVLRGEVESMLAAEEGMPSGYLSPGPGSGLAPGSTVSHYRIVERLGAGGMGEVWLAHDETLDRRVALKFPSPALLGDPSVRQRLQREARAAAALEHPAVCRVFELGQSDGQDFIAMEYLEGETLAVRLSRGPVPLKQALAWGAAIAGAVETAHDKGLVHRDLKPANVMVTPAGEVKVMDFGLARLLPTRGEEAGAAERSDLTAAGMIVGTPAYMAPEQLKGQPADERSDIWAFGCLFYQMLAGKQAFAGDSASETSAAILDHEPDWRPLPTETPWEIRRLLARCLREDPQKRLRHIGDARIEIEESLAAPADTSTRMELPTPGRRRGGCHHGRWRGRLVSRPAVGSHDDGGGACEAVDPVPRAACRLRGRRPSGGDLSRWIPCRVRLVPPALDSAHGGERAVRRLESRRSRPQSLLLP